MNRWLQKGTAVLMAVSLTAGLTLPASAAEGAARQTETLKIAVLSDTHYLSPDLIKDTADFTEHLNSDRKMFAESDAFLNALLNTVKQDDPDVLLISGDLTKDGEKEGHEDMAQKLEDFEQETGVQVYITPGNHDLNNANAMNFNTEDGVAVPAGRTSQADFKEIYGDLVYNDDSLIATFVPAEGMQGGGLSYAARPKDGFTIISIDSARYSADNTESGQEEHETSGAISADLEKWVVEQITAAKKRGDTVIGLEHHGMVEHFGMEQELLPMYLVNDYERLSQVFADAGMQYIFTGHMHANDIASITTEQGNTLYDIETGSAVTYPSPARAVSITRTIEQGEVHESVDVKTYLNVDAGTFINPQTGKEQTIGDITAYGKEHGFSEDMLTTTANGFLHGYYEQIAQTGSKAAIEKLLNDLLGDSLPGDQDLTMEQMLNAMLPLVLPAEPTEENKTDVYFSSGAVQIRYGTSEKGRMTFSLPVSGIADTLEYVFETLDEQIENPAVLDQIVADLVHDLASFEVAKEGETSKTLLDYANYVYQNHLAGLESEEKPAWVSSASEYLNSGALTDDLINVLIRHVAKIIYTLTEQMTFVEFSGITGYTAVDKKPVLTYTEDRSPLLQANENGTKAIAVIIGTIMNDTPATTIPAEYTVKDLLDDVGRIMGSFTGGESSAFDMEEILANLINGTPATDTEPAQEGLVTAEMRQQITGFVKSVVDSMCTDDNYQQDNKTTISYAWSLLTDRTALDQAIAQAETIDLSQYTKETAKAVEDALAAAKDLPLTASQEEMDQAAKALNDSINGLEKIDTGIPDPTQTPAPTQVPDPTETTDESAQTHIPQTGDSANIAVYIVLLAAAGAGLFGTVVYGRKRKSDN